jgi:hypothetical protein
MKLFAPGERLTQFSLTGPPHKSLFINKEEKQKAHSTSKIPLILIKSMTATNIEEINLTQFKIVQTDFKKVG